MKARERYVSENWDVFIKCNKCWEFKKASPEFRRKNSSGFMWLQYLCKNCEDIHKYEYRRREEVMRHRNDMSRDRYKNDEEYRNYMKNKRWSKTHPDKFKEWRKSYIKREDVKEKNRQRYKHYPAIHLRVNRFLKEHNIDIKQCSLCWCQWDTVAHHPDNNKRDEVVFVCRKCHSKIHKWINTSLNIIHLSKLH